MFTNYLLIAMRHFRRQKLYTGINLLGLAIGLASILMIVLYIHGETRFESMHTKRHRIYRVAGELTIRAILIGWPGFLCRLVRPWPPNSRKSRRPCDWRAQWTL